MTREEILRQAVKCVCENRDNQYSPPENNFSTIAEFWSTYLSYDISSIDVAIMMALLKIARIKDGFMKDDSFVDVCGYMACAGELSSNLDKKEEKSYSLN